MATSCSSCPCLKLYQGQHFYLPNIFLSKQEMEFLSVRLVVDIVDCRLGLFVRKQEIEFFVVWTNEWCFCVRRYVYVWIDEWSFVRVTLFLCFNCWGVTRSLYKEIHVKMIGVYRESWNLSKLRLLCVLTWVDRVLVYMRSVDFLWLDFVKRFLWRW